MAGSERDRQELREALCRLDHPYPGDRRSLAAGIADLARTLARSGAEELAELAARATRDGASPAILRELAGELGGDSGWELFEESLGRVATTLYLEAHRRDPSDGEAVLALIDLLGELDLPETLLEVLDHHASRAAPSFHPLWIRARLAAGLGRIDQARDAVAILKGMVGIGGQRDRLEEVEAMVVRWEALDRAGWMGSTGRTARFLALTGCVPLAGEARLDAGAEPGHGYLSAARDLAAFLGASGRIPPRVFELEDASNRILAGVVARTLDLGLEPWPAAGRDEPGLLVVDDMAFLPGLAWFHALSQRRPGQVLFVHALSRTGQGPLPDLTSGLYERRDSPYGRSRPEFQGIDVASEVAGILALPAPPPRPSIPEVLAMLGALSGLPGPLGPEIARGPGPRRRVPAMPACGSPGTGVPSRSDG